MNLIKPVALWGISKGLELPQAALDRMSELAFLRRLIGQLDIDCVLDVGANTGQFARELRGIGYTRDIVSFEPVSSAFRELQEQFAGDEKWHGYQYALGSREHSTSINVHRSSVMSSLLETVVEQQGLAQETVEVKRLDVILSEIARALGACRFFLKMDTQGYDVEVFSGASSCMHLIHGVQSELSVQPLYKNMPHYLEALRQYEAADFELYNLSVVNRIQSGGLLELNCFMRRSS